MFLIFQNNGIYISFDTISIGLNRDGINVL